VDVGGWGGGERETDGLVEVGVGIMEERGWEVREGGGRGGGGGIFISFLAFFSLLNLLIVQPWQEIAPVDQFERFNVIWIRQDIIEGHLGDHLCVGSTRV